MQLYTKTQRIAILFLIAIIIVLMVIRFGYVNYFDSNLSKNDSIAIVITDSLELMLANNIKSFELKKSRKSSARFNLMEFNPNTVDSFSLVKMGFSTRLIKNLINYRNAGGYFKKKEDLLKLYSINDSLYKVISPFIVMPIIKVDTIIKKANYVVSKQRVGINLSSESDFSKLSGIGSVLSSRIVEYRKSLGGFYSINQLTEVYGVDSLLFNSLVKSIFLDSVTIVKQDINSISYKAMAKHPYISGYKVNTILRYRKMRGKIDSLQELNDYKILTKNELESVSNYFYVKK